MLHLLDRGEGPWAQRRRVQKRRSPQGTTPQREHSFAYESFASRKDEFLGASGRPFPEGRIPWALANPRYHLTSAPLDRGRPLRPLRRPPALNTWPEPQRGRRVHQGCSGVVFACTATGLFQPGAEAPRRPCPLKPFSLDAEAQATRLHPCVSIQYLSNGPACQYLRRGATRDPAFHKSLFPDIFVSILTEMT